MARGRLTADQRAVMERLLEARLRGDSISDVGRDSRAAGLCPVCLGAGLERRYPVPDGGRDPFRKCRGCRGSGLWRGA